MSKQTPPRGTGQYGFLFKSVAHNGFSDDLVYSAGFAFHFTISLQISIYMGFLFIPHHASDAGFKSLFVSQKGGWFLINFTFLGRSTKDKSVT